MFGVILGPCPRCRLGGARVTGSKDDPLQGDGVKIWEAAQASVRDCLIEDSRDLVVWYSRGVVLERNLVQNSRYGTHFMYSHDSSVRHSEFLGNVVGVFVMYSSGIRLESNVLAGARGAAGLGVGFKESDSATLSGNQLIANTTGAYFDRTPRSSATPVSLSGNRLALNETALRLHSSEQGLSVTDNEFRSNAQALAVEGGGDALAVNFRNNRWSDYRGYDLDGDGFGDVPYQVEVLSSELKEDVPALRLFEGTAAFALIDAIAHAAPVFSSRLLLVDPNPRFGSSEVAHD
jgi:nitrous oxidase accessory protein